MNHGSFSGYPITRWCPPEPGKTERKMQLTEEFSFLDPDGKPWVVPPDFKVDGATIPRALWTLVGSPYTGNYRRGSIVHDKACEDAGRNAAERRAADRMFFHACMAGGCDAEQATVLYLGVRVGAAAGQIGLLSATLSDSQAPVPRMSVPPADRRLEADFRVAAEQLSRQEITEDPLELERRVDAILQELSPSP